MSANDIPEWAVSRAEHLVLAEGFDGTFVNAFARYIAAHEEAPVDPLLIEAREIAEKRGWVTANSLGLLRDGSLDGADTVQGLLAALRRGIELAKAGEA